MTDLLTNHVQELCSRAKPAAAALALCSNTQRIAALEHCAQALEAAAPVITAANEQDLLAAKEADLSSAMVDRLKLNSERLKAVVADLRAVAAQHDPIGRELETREIAQGLQLQKVSVPLGVIAIIFESRPNVTVDCAALCLRSGNACILRGGREATHTNKALAEALQQGLLQSEVPRDAVQLVSEPDRALVPILLSRDDAIDLVIPRGGEGLIKAVCEVSQIPVVKHDKGVCSLYIHADADVAMATELVVNAKAQRPGVCNAIENLLIDKAILLSHLPTIAAALQAAGVSLRCDQASIPYVENPTLADEADFETEYLALTLAIKTVDGLDEAIAFTNSHSSHHSDGIITANSAAAERYLASVDSAAVYHNASTRFTDGGQFGLGAEVGISTNRLHARGPMGCDELCTYKFVVRGTGQARS